MPPPIKPSPAESGAEHLLADEASAWPSHPASDIWPACAYGLLDNSDPSVLRPTPAWWAHLLRRPELAPPPEACAAELALFERLSANPLQAVRADELKALADPDARENWQHWLAFRDGMQAAGNLEAWYLALMRSARVQIPPSLIDTVVQCIVSKLLEGCDDALEVRAAELLFRPQRVTVQDGVPLAGDKATLDFFNETGGYGDLGRLLAQAQAPLKRVDLRVLTPDHAAEFWQSIERQASSAVQQGAQQPVQPEANRQPWMLDLRHHSKQDLGHGIQFETARAHSAMSALSRVLERWVWRMLGVRVRIQPQSRIQDERWRWHIGLDASASAILNDLYEDREVDAQRQERLLCLFTLRFDHPQEQRADLRQAAAGGVPVYLGLAVQEDGVLRLKPQNLLLNLPVAA